MENEKKIYESPDKGKTVYERPFGSDNSQRKKVESKSYETCIICGKQTEVDVKQHIDFRVGYVEGAGQLCTSCYLKEDKNLFTIDGRIVIDTPNDAELGYKVRSLYWQSKKK